MLRRIATARVVPCLARPMARRNYMWGARSAAAGLPHRGASVAAVPSAVMQSMRAFRLRSDVAKTEPTEQDVAEVEDGVFKKDRQAREIPWSFYINFYKWGIGGTAVALIVFFYSREYYLWHRAEANTLWVENELRDACVADEELCLDLVRIAECSLLNIGVGAPEGEEAKFGVPVLVPDGLQAAAEKATKVVDYIVSEEPRVTRSDVWVILLIKALEASGGPLVPTIYGRPNVDEGKPEYILVNKALQRSSNVPVITGDDCSPQKLRRVAEVYGLQDNEMVALLATRSAGYHAGYGVPPTTALSDWWSGKAAIAARHRRESDAFNEAVRKRRAASTPHPQLIDNEVYHVVASGCFDAAVKGDTPHVTYVDTFKPKPKDPTEMNAGSGLTAESDGVDHAHFFGVPIVKQPDSPDDTIHNQPTPDGDSEVVEAPTAEADDASAAPKTTHTGGFTTKGCCLEQLDMTLLEDAVLRGWSIHFMNNEIHLFLALHAALEKVIRVGYDPETLVLELKYSRGNAIKDNSYKRKF